VIWQDLKPDDQVLKAHEDATLWQTEKGLVKISKGTLVLPVKRGDQRIGYVLHGHGKMLLDAIVETDEGAFGKAVEKEIDKPFLMLGGGTELDQQLGAARKEDLEKAGYKDEPAFKAEAERLCREFLGRKRGCHYERFDEERGTIFAFPDETGEMGILLAKSSKLVYKTAKLVFVSNKDKSVLKSHGAVVISHNGKLLAIGR
jgi:hypothetical protein